MLETAFVVWQALPKNIGNKAVVHGVSYWFALASVLQAVWSIAFAQEATGLAAALLLAITGMICTQLHYLTCMPISVTCS
jgi:hypothetical protein